MTRKRGDSAAAVPVEARVSVVVLAHGKGLPLPAYQSEAAAGLDLMAAVATRDEIVIGAGQRALVPTGLSLELPAGFEGQVRPRSGLALKHGVTVLNSPGTIDADYRGEVKVILINLGHAPFTVRRGERIAQLVVAPVTRALLVEAERLEFSRRGSGGFGSTRVGMIPAAGKASAAKRAKKPAKPRT